MGKYQQGQIWVAEAKSELVEHNDEGMWWLLYETNGNVWVKSLK
jgi:hypothetical protein